MFPLIFLIFFFVAFFYLNDLVVPHDPPLPPGDVKGEVFKDSFVVIPEKQMNIFDATEQLFCHPYGPIYQNQRAI